MRRGTYLCIVCVYYCSCIYCHVLQGVRDLETGLNDLIYWHLIHTTRSYKCYSALANLHTLQFTVTHTLAFSVFTSRILATDLQQSHCHCSTHKVFLSQPNSFLAISSQSYDCHLPILLITINPLLQTVLLITSWHEPHRKHRFLTVPLLQRSFYLAVA
jgi:hypothetical protein